MSTDRLVFVKSTGPREGHAGWVDELFCGHVLPSTGERRRRRRCGQCGPVQPYVHESQPMLAG